MGRSLQGLGQAGSATSLASHLHWYSGVSCDKLGVLRGPKDEILNWRNKLKSSGCPRATLLVAMWSSIRIFFHASPLPSSDLVQATLGL